MTPNRRRILILDDDPGMVRLLLAYLNGPSIDLVACSEIEAAECLMDRERFDVLITDLAVSNLGGLEGFRLVRHVRCNFPKTEVVVFSGNLNEEARTLGRALGVGELLEKPQGLARLREVTWSGVPGDRAARGSGSVRHVETMDEILATGCITALLQPIMSLEPSLRSEDVFAAEGLSRGPEGSLLRNPEVFLDLASRKEKLFEVELQCIEAVLFEGTLVPRIETLFINLRPRSLSTKGFANQLRDLVLCYGYRESDIVIELTEQQSILNVKAFDTALASLREYGFGLALDDYGSGFANLHLVQQLGLDYVKIDGRFCKAIQTDVRKQAIVRSTVEMARELGISTIMERVETEEELGVVRELGVDYAQGYYFSMPMPGRDLAIASFSLPRGGTEAGDSSPGLPQEVRQAVN